MKSTLKHRTTTRTLEQRMCGRYASQDPHNRLPNTEDNNAENASVMSKWIQNAGKAATTFAEMPESALVTTVLKLCQWLCLTPLEQL